MIDLSEEALEKAQEIIGSSDIRAAGYRLLIHPLSSTKYLKAGERDQFQYLAESGFEVQSERETERESKGSDFAVIVDVGKGAWKGPHLEGAGDWAEEGMVIKYLMYAGHEFEHPPGSGVRYRLINDEDVLGYYEGKVTEV